MLPMFQVAVPVSVVMLVVALQMIGRLNLPISLVMTAVELVAAALKL